MKKSIITAAIYMICVSAYSQTLAMPDADIIDEPVTAEAPVSTEAQRQALHNTPSISYKSERNEIRRGNAAFKEERYHDALSHYSKALDVNSGSIRGRYNSAVTMLKLQSDDNKGTENDPRKIAHNLFDQIVPDAKLYDKEIAEKALYNLGNIEFNDENYDRSIEYYKSALRLNPENMATRENLRLAQLKKEEQQNQDQQNQQQDQKQDQQQQQQQQHQQEEQPQEQQPQPQQQQQMTQSAQQILQSMQNKENQTRKKVKEQEPPAGRPQTDKPW